MAIDSALTLMQEYTVDIRIADSALIASGVEKGKSPIT